MTRFSYLAIPVVLALVPAGLGAVTLPEERGDRERGTQVYADNCTACHASAARIMRRFPGDSEGEKAVLLERFLPEHYAPDAPARLDLIIYLLNP